MCSYNCSLADRNRSVAFGVRKLLLHQYAELKGWPGWDVAGWGSPLGKLCHMVEGEDSLNKRGGREMKSMNRGEIWKGEWTE